MFVRRLREATYRLHVGKGYRQFAAGHCGAELRCCRVLHSEWIWFALQPEEDCPTSSQPQANAFSARDLHCPLAVY